jgi:hypothetical protein
MLVEGVLYDVRVLYLAWLQELATTYIVRHSQKQEALMYILS